MADALTVLGSLGKTYASAQPNTDVLKTILRIAAIFLILALLIGGPILATIMKSKENPLPESLNVKNKNTKRRQDLSSYVLEGQNSLYSNLLRSIDPSEQYLVNFSPLTASLSGYIGPVKEGTFDVPYYLQKAFKAGFRSFILPISTYTDDNKRPPNWPASGEPAIVCRTDDGKVSSLNGISVGQFCKELMTYKGENPSQANEPILIFLKEVRGYVPDSVSDEGGYVRFMTNIAKGLEPIEAYRLKTLGGYGSATGGAREMEILTQIPMKELAGKILLFTDFDTRLGLKGAYEKVEGGKLHSMVNFISKAVVSENVNVGAAVGSRTIRVSDVKGSKVNWTDQARVVWHTTALDSMVGMPDPAVVEEARRVGIQAIGLPFLLTDQVDTMDVVKEIWENWKGYAWRVKEPAARYTKPAPVVPAKPSAVLNARVAQDLQPGMTQVR